jgi:hypothetical protein
MPRVEVRGQGSGRDAEAVLTEHVPSEMLPDEHYTDQLGARMGWALADVERHDQAIQAHNGGPAAAAPPLSVRRATARRASIRRATARRRQGDTEASIIDFLAQHLGSTAGDLAKGLNLNPGSVSTRLTQARQGRRDQKGITRLHPERGDATPQTPAPTPSLTLSQPGFKRAQTARGRPLICAGSTTSRLRPRFAKLPCRTRLACGSRSWRSGAEDVKVGLAGARLSECARLSSRADLLLGSRGALRRPGRDLPTTSLALALMAAINGSEGRRATFDQRAHSTKPRRRPRAGDEILIAQRRRRKCRHRH